MQEKFLLKFLGFALLALLSSPVVLPVESGGVNLTASFFDIAVGAEDKEKSLILNQEELADLVKPGVVRIASHIKGKVEVPYFNIDVKKKTISLETARTLKGKTVSIPIDVHYTGGGFIINPDGYILTNSHVVSRASALIEVASQVIYEDTKRAIQALLNAKAVTPEEINRIITSPDFGDFEKEVVEYVLGHSTSTISVHDVFVLNPSSKSKSIVELEDRGFKAELISVNDDYDSSGRDIALIRIGKNNLPSIPMGASKNLEIGNKIFVFGFPAAADLYGDSSGEATFTPGIIASKKESREKDFEYLQIDAKISDGSSGGPLLDEKGEVVGIITLQSEARGGSFAFAIPIDIAKGVLNEKNVANLTSGWSDKFRSGLLNLHNNHCKEGVKDFGVALADSSEFIDFRAVDKYIEKCNAVIAEGASIDTRFDAVKAKFKNAGIVAWAAVAVIVILIAGAFVMIILRRRIGKDEKEIRALEGKEKEGIKGDNNEKPAEIVASSASAAKPPIEARSAPRNPAPVSADPRLVEYVSAARKYGSADIEIRNELLKIGWPVSDINAAFAAVK